MGMLVGSLGERTFLSENAPSWASTAPPADWLVSDDLRINAMLANLDTTSASVAAGCHVVLKL